MTNRKPITLNLCAHRNDSTGVVNNCWISPGSPITITCIGPAPSAQIGP